MILWSEGSPRAEIGPERAGEGLRAALERLGPRKRVLIVPPDGTRAHSGAGPLTDAAWEYYGRAVADVLPALGTHAPMTGAEVAAMFGRVPAGLFRVHDWRGGVRPVGVVPGDLVHGLSEGRLRYDIPVEVDRLVADGGHDLILSVGQVVPHEVAGMSGHSKSIFIGAGGAAAIHRTHFLGAVFGMERIMGRAETPVRRVLRYAAEHFAAAWPIIHVLTVVGRAEDGRLVLRGLFVGDDEECFLRAAALSRETNVELLDEPLRKVVVFLDPAEYRTTWLGNKSIYRTRMVIADGGELIVLAPGVGRFGEDRGVDGVIRKYGYAGTARILSLMEEGPRAAAGDCAQDLRDSPGAAAHLIHGSTEGRFTVTYCPGRMTREEVEAAGYRFGDLAAMTARYDPAKLAAGLNVLADGEKVFFIPNPGLGLWAARERFGAAKERP
ncbi:MAG TPA: lactate racemase domain-containing protein [Terriglobales bacterium]|nr:lactate racemase domain-containing protein [Terriglobales bacterium]